MNNNLLPDKQETPAQAELRQRDAERFGDDPNSIDRLKNFGLHENNGKYYQQIGDEFFEYEPKKEVNNGK